MALHTHGSNNPNGATSGFDRIPMHPYFTFKDLVTIFAFFLVLSVIVFFYPNVLGHSDNYLPANPMQTPSSINNNYQSPIYAFAAILFSRSDAFFAARLINLIRIETTYISLLK